MEVANQIRAKQRGDKLVHYDYYVVNGDTISLFIDGDAEPFETLSIDTLLKKAGYDWERE